jgi:AcrR family transcriptional regulator
MSGPSGPGSATRASTPRGRQRRQQLLQAAADLVAEHGFHSVGIADIGAAAGVTGSAIYRHFKDKTELLVALFDDVVEELLIGAGDATAAGGRPETVLDALVGRHVRFALRERALIAVYNQEAQNLPKVDRTRLRRNMRTYVLAFAGELQRLRPEMSEDEARTRVQATFGLLNSVSQFPPRLSGEALGELLHAMALRALTM